MLPDGTVCGGRAQKSLSIRTHVCLTCGCVLDRDENTARNILRQGQKATARQQNRTSRRDTAIRRQHTGLPFA